MRVFYTVLALALSLNVLNAQTCPIPNVHFNIRLFVDPNGVIARNLRNGEKDLQRALTVAKKRVSSLVNDNGINVVGFTTKIIQRDEYIRLVGEGTPNPERFVSTLNIPPNAEYLFDIVVGEDVNGVKAYGFVINVKSQKIYKFYSVSSSFKKAKVFVVATVVKLVKELINEFKQNEGPQFVSAVINRTETVKSIKVLVSPNKPHLRNTAFARVRIVEAKNEYGENIFNYLGNQTGIALKVDVGKVVNGSKIGEGFKFIRSDAPEFVVQLPSCSEFDNTGKMTINMQFAYLCPRKNIILTSIDQSDRKSFVAEAPLAWKVRETWNLDSKYSKVSFTVNYQLHFAANCKDKIRRTVFYEGMKVPKADWISDNFVYDEPVNKPKVSNVHFSDCGLFEPWTTSDKEVDEFRVVGFDDRGAGITELGYFISGLDMESREGFVQDFFGMNGLNIIGEKVVFGDYDAYIKSMVSLPLQKMRAFKPFTYTQILTGTIPNEGCGDHNATIQIKYEFQPMVDCYCAKVVEEEEKAQK